MRHLLRIAAWIDNLTEKLGQASMVAVLATIAVGFYNVLARYLGRLIGLKLSSNLLIELQWYLFSLGFFLGFAYILKHQLNVRVDFLYAHWSPRRKALVDCLGHLLFLIPFCLMAIVVTIDPVLLSWGRLSDGSWGAWEISPDPDGLPRAPIKSFILLAFGSLLLQSLAEVIKALAVVTGYRLDPLPERDAAETEFL